MKYLVWAGLVVIGALVACGTWNAIYAHHLEAKFPPPGKIYEVNGYNMHLDCSGAGSPTVVLEGGRGDDWIYWQKVQPQLSKTTRVCTYDRAGLGWSEPQPGPRDAVRIAAQLHSLLGAAGERGPFVLIGASAGGFYVRQFASAYPGEVAGVAFVDASMPEMADHKEDPFWQDSPEQWSKRHREARWEWIKTWSGWYRLRGQCTGQVERGLESYYNYATAETCRPKYATSYLGEWDDFWRSGEQARAARCCQDFPVLVISQDPDRPKPNWDALSIKMNPVWADLQEHLKDLSPRSRRIIASRAGHHIMIDRPDVVISGIRELVEEIRGAEPAGPYGSTLVQ